MLWYLLLIGVVAYVVWDFRRFQAKKDASRENPEIDPERIRAVAERARSSARAPETGGERRPPAAEPRRVYETVSVVLRRQIPPRDEAPRSWLGGLPMLPGDVEWPRSVSSEYPDRGERPLHFLAQIACADLPAELWGGLGPRTGSLLFFVDPNQGAPEEADAFRIMHVDGLLAERPAPDDLGPVHDGMYSGARYDYLASVEDVPATWRRWPVDLVVVPNEARIEGQRTRVAPEDFAAILYPGEEIAPGSERPEASEPFTWRGALYVVDGLARGLSEPLRPLRIPDAFVEKLNRPGYVADILATRVSRDAEWRERNRALIEGPEPQGEAERARRANAIAWDAERSQQREALAAFLAQHPNTEAVVAYLKDADQRLRGWRERAAARIAQERAAVRSHDLDSPIDAAAWEGLKARLDREPFSAWTYHWTERDGDSLHLDFAERTDRLGHDQRGGDVELIADYYVDPAKRSLIPHAIIEQYEPLWRRLYDNRPHRIGGYHDGLQSDAAIGPVKDLLLFQIATDDAMHWCWGDVGAYYVFITPDALEKGDYAQATITLECY